MPRNPFAPVTRGNRKHSAAASAAMMAATSPGGTVGESQQEEEFLSTHHDNFGRNRDRRPATSSGGNNNSNKNAPNRKNDMNLSGRGRAPRTPSTTGATLGSLSPAMMGAMWRGGEGQILDMPSLISSSSSISTGGHQQQQQLQHLPLNDHHDFPRLQPSFSTYVDEEDEEDDEEDFLFDRFGFGAQPRQTPLVKDDEIFFADFSQPRGSDMRHPASAFHHHHHHRRPNHQHAHTNFLTSPTMQARSSHYISDDDEEDDDENNDDDDDDIFNIGGLNNTTTVDATQEGAIEVVNLAPPSTGSQLPVFPFPATAQSAQPSDQRGSLPGSLKGLSIKVDTDDDEMIDTDDSASSYTLNRPSLRQELILERIMAQRAGDGHSDASNSVASRSQNSRRPSETPAPVSSSTITTQQQQQEDEQRQQQEAQPQHGLSTRVLVDGAATALSSGAVVENIHSPATPPPTTPPPATGLRRLAPRLGLGRRRSANQWNRLPSGDGDSIGGQDVAAAVAVPTPGRRMSATPQTTSPSPSRGGATAASNGAQVATTGTAMNVLTPRRLEGRLHEAATLEETIPTQSNSRHSSAPLLQVRRMTFVTPKRTTSETAAVGKTNNNGKNAKKKNGSPPAAAAKSQQNEDSSKPVARESSDRTMSTNSTNPIRAKRRRKSVMDLARAESERKYWKKRLAETVITFGSVHVRTAEHLLHLGNAHVRCKEYNEALGVFKSSVRILRQIHGDNHLSVAHALDRVGFAASRCGRRYAASRGNMVGLLSPTESASSSPVQPPRKASRVSIAGAGVQAMDTSADTTNTEDTEYSPIANDNDSDDTKLADWALAALHEAFNIRYAQLGPTHCDVVDTLNNIAGIHLHRGELAEARDGYAEVLTVRSHIFGPSHPSVAVTAHALGGVYMRMSDLDEALRFYNVALRIYRADQMKLKDTHPMVTRVMRDIASTERIMVSMGYR